MRVSEWFKKVGTYTSISLGTKIIDFAVFWLVIKLSNNLISANLLAAIVSIGLNFKLHSTYTYRGRTVQHAFNRYLVVTLTLFLFETSLLQVAIWLELDILLSKVLTSTILSLFGLLAMDRWIFKKLNDL
jgi:putative flippase GtrA